MYVFNRVAWKVDAFIDIILKGRHFFKEGEIKLGYFIILWGLSFLN